MEYELRCSNFNVRTVNHNPAIAVLSEEDGEHILFFSLDGTVVLMSLNRRECRTWTKVSTMLATVATLHETTELNVN